MPKLTIDRASKKYRLEREARDVPAFAEVSLSVEEGEFVAIIGPSGCGKTSLLNVVAGLLPFEEGSVTLDGRDVALSIFKHRKRPKIRANVAKDKQRSS